MSRTYDIACMTCRKALWIGQASGGAERGRIYTDPKHLQALNAFLFDHEGHDLQFLNDQNLPEDFDEEWARLCA